jgi:hypothetical protein
MVCFILHFIPDVFNGRWHRTHMFRIVFRVQRDDDQSVDQKTGKPKLFDIVVEKPVDILAVSVVFRRPVLYMF